jgi:hypothetical protein
VASEGARVFAPAVCDEMDVGVSGAVGTVLEKGPLGVGVRARVAAAICGKNSTGSGGEAPRAGSRCRE